MAEKRLKASERKEEIIKAAIKVVAESNFDKATIAEIAKEAGVNESLIYQHFDNKVDLMVSVIDYINKVMSRVTFSTPGLDNPALSSLREAAVTFYESAKFNVDMLKCVTASIIASDKKIKERSLEHVKISHKFIEGRVRLAMDNNLIDPSLDVEMIAWALLANVWMLSMMLIFGESSLMSMERLDKLSRQLEEMIKPR